MTAAARLDRLAAMTSGGRNVSPVLGSPSAEPRGLPAVSVVVPCYNYGRYLPGAVTSALSQPGIETRVIIVDDASTDDSLEVAQRLAAADSRITVVPHPRNQGHIATYNDGLTRADGEYVVLLSADDLLAAGAVRRAVDLLQANPRVGFAYGLTEEFLDEPPPVADVGARSWTLWDGRTWLDRRARSGHNCINCPEVVMRTSLHRKIGWYRADLPHSGDFELWMRAAAKADVGRVNGAVQAFYRVHPASMQRTQYGTLLADLIGRRAAFDAVFAPASGSTLDGGQLWSTARRTLAGEALSHAARFLEGDGAEPEQAAALIDFAGQTYERPEELRQWRAVERRRSGGPRARVLGVLAPPVRAINGKVRWRRWRWTGI